MRKGGQGRRNRRYSARSRVPMHAITMGIGTILDSRQIVLLAGGKDKHEAIARLRSGHQTIDFPASALWTHSDVLVLLDEQAV